MDVEVNNFRMAYQENGAGLPLLLIHGYPLHSRMWEPQLRGLAGAARVIAPDLRGHGESEPFPGPYWMDQLADDIAGFLDALHINQPIVLCGLSMGGYVAMAFYRQHSARLRGLILAATRAGPDSPKAKTERDRAADKVREAGVDAVIEEMLPKMLSKKTYDQQPGLVDYVKSIMRRISPEAVEADLMGMKERPDSMPTLKGVRLPVLILQGEDDQILSREDARAMDGILANSRLVLIPDAGHLLNLEQPDRFNREVEEYLAGLQSLDSSRVGFLR